jgi:predicted ester cyclase
MRTLIMVLLLCTLPAFAQTPVPSPEEANRNVELLTKYYEHARRNEIDEQLQLWSRDATNNGEKAKPEALRAALADFRRTFPDYQSVVLEMRAVGDTVVALSRISGTHQGVAQTNLFGGLLKGARPTGKRFEVLVTHWWRFRDGKIVWHQVTRDDLGILKQLGLVPATLPADKLSATAATQE